MDRPKFSITIPVYLRESEHKAVVEDTINSFRENYPDVELVVVDDGSILPTGFLRDLADIYVRQPNSGISRAWNVGKNLARGEFVLIANDDIKIPSGLLESLSKGFENEKTAVVAPEKGGPFIEPSIGEGNYHEDHIFYPGYCFMLKRDRFFEDFDENFRTNCGDADYWERIMSKGLELTRSPVSIWHKEGDVLHGMNYKKISEDSINLFVAKHGFSPQEKFYS
jgi:glycosyltransferase involved in cell wall biosynthesis